MNQWDTLTDIFGCRWDEAEIPACAADNICIAWPSMLSGVDRTFPEKASLSVLDFGCGGGLFCRCLHGLGHTVTGYDRSEELVKVAQGNVPPEVLVTSNRTVIEGAAKYDLITSIMVLPFIEDLHGVLGTLARLVKGNGVIIQAVFHPEFVMDNFKTNRLVTDFSSETNSGFLELEKGVKIPVHIRSESEYRQAYSRYGLAEIYRDSPPFSQEFLAKYQMPFSTRYPEYLIQAFGRRAA
ncbi:MAG: class I SAM-dependent methyltransferase [Deltaproteobacteria bacterium]|nr:class I SAM-dependent methyltransferase [Deltaproteobacteria bacterium]